MDSTSSSRKIEADYFNKLIESQLEAATK